MNISLHWAPEGRQKWGRPKNSWHPTVKGELKTFHHTWGPVQKLAQNRQEWDTFVAALHASRHSGHEWVSDGMNKEIYQRPVQQKSQNIFQINMPWQTTLYLSLDGETGEWRESLPWSPGDCSRLIASCVGLLLTLLTVDPLIPLGGPVFSGLLGGVGGGVKIGSEAL